MTRSRTCMLPVQWTAISGALCALLLAGCAATGSAGSMRNGQAGELAGGPLQESEECKAAQLKAPEPMPASALSADMLRQARSGHVSLRYDVIQGRAENIVVALSQPPGLYDDIALSHAKAYRDPAGRTARGCLMTINVQF